MTDAVANGIKERYGYALATYQHKDENVATGREFVRAYVVEYTHYVERLPMDAMAKGEHGEKHHEAEHAPARDDHDH